MGMLKKITGFFFSVVMGMGFIALAFITLLPATASKPNMLGYYGVCSFAPVSTIILLVLSAAFILLGVRMIKSPAHPRKNAIPLSASILD